jgi:hypothetical protein
VGISIYRVTEEQVMCSDGMPANVAAYGWPAGPSDAATDYDMRLKHAPLQPHLNTGRIAICGQVYNNDRLAAFINDTTFGTVRHPLPGVTVAPARFHREELLT